MRMADQKCVLYSPRFALGFCNCAYHITAHTPIPPCFATCFFFPRAKAAQGETEILRERRGTGETDIDHDTHEPLCNKETLADWLT